MKICIYASDLAVITGHNKYQDVSEIILKLWQRNFPEDYSNILNKVSESTGVDIVEETPEEILKRLSKTHKIDDVSSQLYKCLKADNVSDLKTNQNSLIKKFEKLPESDKALVKECVKRKTNTNFGTKFESTTLKKYMEETGDKVDTVNTFYKKDLFITKNKNVWSIGGRIDGINKDKVLIEIKNRVNKLFYKLRDYEKVQVYAYMSILNLQKAKLVESIKTNNSCDINIIDVEYDPQWWETEIEAKVSKFIKKFEKFLYNEEKKIELCHILFATNT